MKDKTLNNILYISLGITSFAAFLVAIVIFYKAGLWEPTIAAGFIGFTGAVIGGIITLMGVNKTIQENRKIYNQEKYERADYVFTELLQYLIDIDNKINGLNPASDWNKQIDEILTSATKLKATVDKVLTDAKLVNMKFYKQVKSVEYFANRIIDYESDILPGRTDNQVRDLLMSFRYGINDANNKLFSFSKEIEHS